MEWLKFGLIVLAFVIVFWGINKLGEMLMEVKIYVRQIMMHRKMDCSSFVVDVDEHPCVPDYKEMSV